MAKQRLLTKIAQAQDYFAIKAHVQQNSNPMLFGRTAQLKKVTSD
jgi:hypothetical protein